jgi:O-antigen ligase
MAKKRRSGPAARPGTPLPAGPAASASLEAETSASARAQPLVREASDDGWAAGLLALTIFLAPALGVPGEEMLQDTLKSAIVSLGTLAAALLFLLAVRQRREPLRWHAVLWLPLLLTAYALGSMAWSHTYLASVETIRWFIFSVIVWLGLNTLARERLPLLASCVHAGSLVASVWAMAQFWGGMDLFPQGPQPSSTFINRNFFAEFAVCALPFGVLLLARARRSAMVAVLALTLGMIVTALLMTGTRSALMAMWLELVLVFPLIAWRCRGQLAFPGWPRKLKLLALALLAGSVLVLGAIPTSNPKILEEQHGATPIERGLRRTESIGPNDYSLGVRMIMWRATLNAIKARPLAGLGAGAWESEIPLYQAEGSQLETDYYVHNEFLQLVSEYGVVGWVFLLGLLAYLAACAWRTWRDSGADADAERPWRAIVLASLLALMVVSNIGFPWRLAATGALFALCLGALAASDARLGLWRARVLLPLRWSPAIAHGALVATAACIGLALLITQRAAEVERKLVGAARIALSITASGDWNNPRYDALKKQMLQEVREGIALDRHYRKITPMVADELARWGDWPDATWIWDSVLSSRPYVVAIITNAARGYASMGQTDKALAYLKKAKKIQPEAPAVRSLEVILLARSGDEQQAMRNAREALAEGIVDYDLVNTYAMLAWRAHEYPLARQLLQQRMQRWPESRARGLLQLGLISREQKDTVGAVESFRQALAAASPQERPLLANDVPAELRAQVDAAAQKLRTN